MKTTLTFLAILVASLIITLAITKARSEKSVKQKVSEWATCVVTLDETTKAYVEVVKEMAETIDPEAPSYSQNLRIDPFDRTNYCQVGSKVY